MAYLNDILKWARPNRTTRTTDIALDTPNHLPNAGPCRTPSGSWPERFVNPRDGSAMRLVPGGEFTMGSTRQETESAQNMDQDGERYDLIPETPQFSLFVPAFYMGEFTVTNAQFVRFLSEWQPEPALFDLWVYSMEHIFKPQGEGGPYCVEPGFERHPVAHVTWFGAEAYCRWAKLRMPTEVEWEKAARGTDARLFPWGNDWHDNFLCWRRRDCNSSAPTVEVDAFPEGCSPYGIFQMSGNVAEWCEDWFQPRFYDEHAMGNRRPPFSGDERVLRGGTCLQAHRLEFRCAMRQRSTPVFLALDFTGIRCVCDFPISKHPLEQYECHTEKLDSSATIGAAI